MEREIVLHLGNPTRGIRAIKNVNAYLWKAMPQIEILKRWAMGTWKECVSIMHFIYEDSQFVRLMCGSRNMIPKCVHISSNIKPCLSIFLVRFVIEYSNLETLDSSYIHESPSFGSFFLPCCKYGPSNQLRSCQNFKLYLS